MKQEALRIVALFVTIIVFLSVATTAQITSEALWKKYTHETTAILARHYCAQANQVYPCKALDTTTFQIAVNPIDASWHMNSADVCATMPV